MFKWSKYDLVFDQLVRSPGEEMFVCQLANKGSAGVQAFRIKRNFYREGNWRARCTKDGKVYAIYVGPIED